MRRTALTIGAVLVMTGCTENSFAPTRIAGGTAGTGTAATDARIDPATGHGGGALSAMLTGAAEVPGPGDPDGSGSAQLTLNPGQQEVCFRLAVRDIEPASASHIHAGPAGVAGPVVVTLSPPPTSGSSTGCVMADRGLVVAILENPEDYYVNVHNAAFPAGAVRGQLSP